MDAKRKKHENYNNKKENAENKGKQSRKEIILEHCFERLLTGGVLDTSW